MIWHGMGQSEPTMDPKTFVPVHMYVNRPYLILTIKFPRNNAIFGELRFIPLET